MSFQFANQLAMSDDAAIQDAVSAYIRQNFAGVVGIERAGPKDDRRGTDFWAVLESGKKLSFDVKIREIDYAFRDPPQDDLALELWSVVGQKTGWTRDASKQTDFILWHWKDTGRDCLLSFPELCSVFNEKAEEWKMEYADCVRTQTTVNLNKDIYQSQCVFVPRKVVIQAMLTKYSGMPGPAQLKLVQQEESSRGPCP